MYIFCIATQIHKTFGGLVGTYTTKLSNPLGKKTIFFYYVGFTCNITGAFGGVVKDIFKNINLYLKNASFF